MECLECEAPADVRHHVIPRSRGGRATVPLCSACHSRAHVSDLGSLRAEANRRAFREGKHAGGLPPYGWTVRGGRLHVVEQEQRAINSILALRFHGRTYTEIAASVAADGYPSRGAAWTANAVRKIVIRYFGPTDAE